MNVREVASSPSFCPAIPDHELIELIGRGSYGEVWRARNVVGTERAVKIVRRQWFDSDRPYLREFNGIQKFEPVSRQHDGVVDILHLGRAADDSYFYYVMELADAVDSRATSHLSPCVPSSGIPEQISASDKGLSGSAYAPGTLRAVLKSQGRLPLGEVVELGVAICEALGHLHRHGLVHRDVKPSNLIFVGGRLKLADIGLVAGVGEAKSFVGTEGYIPPEGPGSPQADLYSLGKVLYEASTGKDRNEFPDLPEDFRGTHEGDSFADLNEILLRACAADPARRYASAEQMRAELLLLQSGRSVRGLRANERLLKRLKFSGAMGTVLLILALGAFAFQQRETRLARERQQAAEALARVEVEHRREIEAQAHLLRHTAYAADMTLTAQALERGDEEIARQTLLRHVPAAGQPDVRGWEWRHYWHRAEGDPSVGLLAGTNGLNGLALVPGTATLLSCGGGGEIQQWDPAARKLLRRWDTGDHLWWAIAVHPSGTNAVVLSALNDEAALIDLRSGEYRLVPLGGDNAGFQIIASPDGTAYLHTSGGWGFAATNGLTMIRDATFTPMRTLPQSGQRSALSATGHLLATGAWIDRIKLWRWPGLEPAGELGPVGGIASLDFSPDGRWLVTGGNLGELCLWDVTRRELRHRREAHDRTTVGSVQFSPDGRSLLTATGNQTLVLWDAESLTPRRVLRGYADLPVRAIWSQDGNSVYSTTHRYGVRVWPVADPPTPQITDGMETRHTFFSPDSRWIAHQVRTDGGIAIRLAADQTILAQLPGPFWNHGFLRDGQGIVLGLTNLYQLGIYSVTNLSLLRDVSLELLPAGTRLNSGTAISPDNLWIAKACSSGEIAVWELSTGRLRHLFVAHPRGVLRLCFSHDSRWLLSCGEDATVRLWSVDDFKPVSAYQGQAGASSMAFSSDDRMVVLAWLDGGAAVYDRETSQRLGSFPVRADGLVCFSPDGRTLIVADYSQLQFWNLVSGREAGALALGGHKGHFMTLSPDGQVLATTTMEGTIRLFRAPPPILPAPAPSVPSR